MNTRLQVEHPVTELVYGVGTRPARATAHRGSADAHAGTLNPRGHAIVRRITAEDPFNEFPATDVVRHLRVPGGRGGVESGNAVTLFYDPLLGELIVWWRRARSPSGADLRRALRELVIVGLPTSQAFHLRVMGYYFTG